MKIDCYGNQVFNPGQPLREKKEYQREVSGSSTYIRFSSALVGPIHMIDTSVADTTTTAWAYGDWSDRTTLSYDADLNTTIDI